MPANIAFPVWKFGQPKEKEIPKGKYRVTFGIPKSLAATIGDQTIEINRNIGSVHIEKIELRPKAGEALAYAKVIEPITINSTIVSTQTGGSSVLSMFGVKKVEYILFSRTMFLVLIIGIVVIVPQLRHKIFPFLKG